MPHYGLCSRRKAEEWILEGRISVDGLICRDVGTQVDVDKQSVHVDGKPLETAPETIYLAIHKPRGYITTSNDPQGRKIVLDLLPNKFKNKGLFPVGRLDAESEGLLLLTNNGEWSQILLHPSHQVWKEYEIECNKPVTHDHLAKLAQGIILDGKKTLPAKIEKLDSPNRFLMQIREGKNRQIRRMCNALGLKVERLRRVKIGPIELGSLESGKFRPLTSKEIKEIWALNFVEEKK